MFYSTPKKAHYHVILTYSGPTSYNVVKALTDGFNQPIPQALEQVRGYYRYLTHKDNPEKAQYDERDIKTINGFNIADFSELTRSEITQIKKTLQALIRQYDTATTEIYSLSLHDALPIYNRVCSTYGLSAR